MKSFVEEKKRTFQGCIHSKKLRNVFLDPRKTTVIFFPLPGFSLTSKAVLFSTVQIALVIFVLRMTKNVITKWSHSHYLLGPWFSLYKIFLPEKHLMRKTALHKKHNRWFLHPVHIFELSNEYNIWQFKSMLMPYSCNLQTNISSDDPHNMLIH